MGLPTRKTGQSHPKRCAKLRFFYGIGPKTTTASPRNMILFRKIPEMKARLRQHRKAGGSIGFVPTMGALHQGHISLIETSRSRHDLTVCSIFVNPTQFNDPLDYQKYPVSLEADIRMLAAAGTELLFLPTPATLYPNGTTALETYALGHLESVWEGPNRPGHFQGVCQVMRRLLEAVEPQGLYMGQKDYQQCQVVARLLRLMNASIQLVTCPTLREADGLAMSSRNRRLSVAARQQAPALYQAMQQVKNSLQPGPLMVLLKEGDDTIRKAGFQPEYFAIADAATLEPVDFWDGEQQLVLLAAAFLDGVRLIDNLPLN